VQHRLKNYEAAQLLLTQALEIGKQVLPPDDPFFAQLFSALGDVYFASGRPTESLAAYSTALTIQKQLDPEGSDCAYSLSAMGEAHLAMGKPLLAMGPLEQGLRLSDGPKGHRVLRA